jgi:CRISPR-associated protein Cmr4
VVWLTLLLFLDLILLGVMIRENLPPETLMASLLMATRERSPNGGMSAEDVLGKAQALINDRLVQVGGDATTGRGLMIVHAVE